MIVIRGGGRTRERERGREMATYIHGLCLYDMSDTQIGFFLAFDL